ncbi:MAG TPA: CAP domain-containing protein [bacterium]|nr:CAP domain-containing protein [bacterium]
MKKIFIFIIVFVLFSPISASASNNLAASLSGRILLQVEARGEAWYVNPVNLKRYYLGRPEDAYNIMRKLGLGISNADLTKIPISTDVMQTVSNSLTSRVSGRILLQVEARGEAWYVNPVNLKRYYLGRPEDAYNIMRKLGLGITNADLYRIISFTPSYQATFLERAVFDAVNAERAKNGRTVLIWNDELAAVAREHSQDLAKENEQYTGIGYSCDYPLIHHEGTSFGFYNSERLNNRGVYYFSKSGENIALIPEARYKVSFIANDPAKTEVENCGTLVSGMDSSFKTAIEEAKNDAEKLNILQAEVNKRIKLFQQAKTVNVVDVSWFSTDDLVGSTVNGWMNSEGHRRNILDSDYTESGLGIASINGYMIATQVFIRRASCGFETGPCCEKIGYYPYCFTPLTCQDRTCR